MSVWNELLNETSPDQVFIRMGGQKVKRESHSKEETMCNRNQQTSDRWGCGVCQIIEDDEQAWTRGTGHGMWLSK